VRRKHRVCSLHGFVLRKDKRFEEVHRFHPPDSSVQKFVGDLRSKIVESLREFLNEKIGSNSKDFRQAYLCIHKFCINGQRYHRYNVHLFAK
jgi:hypothetical protein